MAEHIKAYTGMDQVTGQKFAKGLKSISESKVNSQFASQNIKQQAGFSAEVETKALENEEKILNRTKGGKAIRTDDMRPQTDGQGHPIGGTNDQLYDVADVDKNGNYIRGTGVQLKYIGNDPKDACQKLMSKKFDKYGNANVPIEVPSDFYDGMKQNLSKKEDALRKQIAHSKAEGNASLATKQEKELARVHKRNNLLRKGKLTSKEAVEARCHPIRVTAKNMLRNANGAGLEAVTEGAKWGAVLSMAKNIVAVAQGKKDLDDAMIDVAKETGSAAVVSYGIGAGGSLLKGAMSQASQKTLRDLSKTNLPASLTVIAVDAGKTIAKYMRGEISGTECFVELGENGFSMSSASLYAVAGQALIPVPIVGAMVGSMVGYAIAASSYGMISEALQRKKEATAHRAEAERFAKEHVRMMREMQQQMDQMVQTYLKGKESTFDAAFKGMREAVNAGNIDGFVASTNTITESLGEKPVFRSRSELDELMEGDEPIKI